MKSIETRMKKVAENNRRWYHFKDYSVRCVALYPLMVIFWYCHAIYEKIQKKINSSYQWDEKRANKIITWSIIHWADLKNNTIYYDCSRYYTCWNDKYHSPLLDRGFCFKYSIELTEYLINEYQLEGYEKEVECFDGTVYFAFRKKA